MDPRSFAVPTLPVDAPSPLAILKQYNIKDSTAGIDVNAKDRHGWSALHYACHCDFPERTDCVRMMLPRADVNAATTPNPLARDELLRQAHTPAQLAARSSSCAILRLLVLHGCNVNVKDARGRSLATIFVISSAAQDGIVGVCAALQQLLDTRGSGGSSLIESVDTDGWRVMHHAAKAGAEAIVKTLLKMGANPCVRTVPPPRGGASFTPLDLACGSGNQSLIRLLKAAADEFSTPAPPPVPTGIEFASSDDDADEPPPPPPLFPADFFSPSGSGGSPDFLQQTPPPPMPLPPLPPPLDVSALARELQVQGLSEEEQIAIAMEESLRMPPPGHRPPPVPSVRRSSMPAQKSGRLVAAPSDYHDSADSIATSPHKARIGLTLQDHASGCLVLSVSDTAVFIGAALKPNDVIFRINGAPAHQYKAIFALGDASTPYKISFFSAGKSQETTFFKHIVADVRAAVAAESDDDDDGDFGSLVAVGASATQAAVAAAGRGRKMSLPSDLQQQQQKLLQQVQHDQQQQRQRHHEQQQQLVQQPQHYRPAAAAARELAADLRAQHAVAGAGGGLRVPAMPAISSPSLVAPALAPSSPSAAAGHFEHEIPFQELQLGKLLGSGSFGDVYSGVWCGSSVAVKMLKVGSASNKELVQDFKRELELMSKLRHNNVVMLYGGSTIPPRLAIVTEFVQRGSLWDILRRSQADPSLLPWSRRLKFAAEAAAGMMYLHSRKPPIVHRDVKSDNFLITADWNLKVCDFGLARVRAAASHVQTVHGRAGTPAWMAPEVLRGDPFNETSDLYSFGVVLWELLTLRPPWEGMDPFQLPGLVGFKNQRLPLPSAAPPDCPPMFLQIIRECFQTDPAKRPRFDAVQRNLLMMVQQQQQQQQQRR